jgi:cytochrome c5
MRKTKLISILLVTACLGLTGVLALAEEKPTAQDTAAQAEIAKLSGKDLYKRNCKACHLADSPNGEYTPMTYIQEQWERFFDEQYVETHEAMVDSAFGGRKVIELITPEMLQKIRRFCIDGAADSEHPMTCG